MRKAKVFAPVLALFLVFALLASALPEGRAQAASGKTGSGLAEFALQAYEENWEYAYGAASSGKTDCSGLIYVYAQSERSSSGLLSASPQSGSIETLPRIHGLGLWKPGHVGVYLGDGTEVDNRGEGMNVCRGPALSHKFQKWFKVPGVAYPDTGWVSCLGERYYYEDGQYVVNCTKTIDGVSYTFGSDGTVNGQSAAGGERADKPAASTSQEPAPSQAPAQEKPAQAAPAQDPAPSEAPAAAVLQYGSSGVEVENLQRRLKELGYFYEAPDGSFDFSTQNALEVYQASAGFAADGVAGQEILAHLYGEDAPHNPEEGTVYPGMHSSAMVTDLQKRLVELGYLETDAFGYYGEETQAAVLACQRANGLTETGTLDTDARAALRQATVAAGAPVQDTPPASAAVMSSAAEEPTRSAAPAQAVAAEAKPYAAAQAAREAQRPAEKTAGGAADPAASQRASLLGFLAVVLTALLAGICVFFRSRTGRHVSLPVDVGASHKEDGGGIVRGC